VAPKDRNRESFLYMYICISSVACSVQIQLVNIGASYFVKCEDKGNRRRL
jgi:hypothetical protein